MYLCDALKHNSPNILSHVYYAKLLSLQQQLTIFSKVQFRIIIVEQKNTIL